MKHKSILFAVAIATLACGSANAQNMLGRLAEKAKNAAENTVGTKIENAVSGAIDKATTKKDKNSGKQDQKTSSAEADEAAASTPANANTAAKSTWTCPECGKTGNTGDYCDDCGAKRPSANGSAPAQAAPAPQTRTSDILWNNYDFVAGDEIIFEDTQENEQLGEFPSMWDSFQGNAQIAKIDGNNAINLQDAVITPLFNNGKPYLTEKCTVEMDLYLYNEDTYKTVGGGTGLNDYKIILAKLDEITKVSYGDYSLCIRTDCSFNPKDNGKADVTINYEWTAPGDDKREGSYTIKDVELNSWHHIAISFNQRAYKVYFDEQRVANIPNAVAPKWLQVEGSYDYERLYFIKNVRIAKGAVPLYDRLASDGKIVSYGITFDTGKATIKGESMGEINRIKALMDQDKTLKFEVQGHCDNTGSASVNDKLSQQRAEAIVAALVNMGISADRLTAVGKGASVPIASNNSDEGRAKNRRVEFIKK